MHICKVQVFPGLVAQKKFKFKINNNNKKIWLKIIFQQEMNELKLQKNINTWKEIENNMITNPLF